MKTQLIIILSFLFSVYGIAQPTVSGQTTPAKDTTIILPVNSITLTGTATQANPGHPILDTTWVETSGPAATITNPSNRMTTKVTGMVQGNYVFTLTATDKQNSASATVKVTVLNGVLSTGLANFNISRNNEGILLSWQTNMEENNSHFIIQRSSDGSNFTDIATILSKAENGNSDVPLNYSYQIFGQVITANMNNLLLAMGLLAFAVWISRIKNIYKKVLIGLVCISLVSCSKSTPVASNVISSKTEYRLKQVDLQGHFTYSEVKFAN
jgi:hypothetical protein